MNQILIFLVPKGATQRDFKSALHDLNLEPLETTKTERSNPDPAPIKDNEPLPLWTLFVPNPCI